MRWSASSNGSNALLCSSHRLKDGYVSVVLVFRPGGKLADVAAGVDVFSSPGRGDGFAISIAFGKPMSYNLSVRCAPKTLVELSETLFVDEENTSFQWQEAHEPAQVALPLCGCTRVGFPGPAPALGGCWSVWGPGWTW